MDYDRSIAPAKILTRGFAALKDWMGIGRLRPCVCARPVGVLLLLLAQTEPRAALRVT